MSIKFIKRKNIDVAKFDACVEASERPLLYGYSWFLDRISPNWGALVFDDYEAVMPLSTRKKWGVNYICQPPFSQKTSVFSRHYFTREELQRFFKAIPKKFVLWDFYVDEQMASRTIKSTPFINYELSLGEDYDSLKANFSTNCKRNLKKSEQYGWSIQESTDVKQVVQNFRSFRGAQYESNLSDLDYQRFQDFAVFALEHNKGILLNAKDAEGKDGGSIFYAFDGNAFTCLFMSITPLGVEQKASFAIMNQLIKTNSSSNFTLDFEGSMIEGVARFYKGFGAKETRYYRMFKKGFKLG